MVIIGIFNALSRFENELMSYKKDSYKVWNSLYNCKQSLSLVIVYMCVE